MTHPEFALLTPPLSRERGEKSPEDGLECVNLKYNNKYFPLLIHEYHLDLKGSLHFVSQFY